MKNILIRLLVKVKKNQMQKYVYVCVCVLQSKGNYVDIRNQRKRFIRFFLMKIYV